jgi:hypothetical protein
MATGDDNGTGGRIRIFHNQINRKFQIGSFCWGSKENLNTNSLFVGLISACSRSI